MDQETTLQQIEEYASLFFTIREISLLLDLDPDLLRREIRHGRSDIALAYQRGKLKNLVAIRKMTVEFAKKGSPQAEMLVKEYVEKMESDE